MITSYNAKEVSPYYPTCIDIETAPNGDCIGVGFAYLTEDNEIEYHAFDSIELWYAHYVELIKTAKKDKNRKIQLTRIYAHNGANFDYLKFYEILIDNDELLDAQYFTADSTGIGVQFTLKSANVKVTLLDSYRMLPASLAKLSDTFEIAHPKQVVPDECKNNYLLFKQNYPQEFWSYLENDVRGLQEILYKFWSEIYRLFGNVGHMPMTLPSLVMRVFSKQIDEDIYTPTNEKQKQLERDAYKGGLTLCLRTGVFDNVNVYDVNSMYPAAMKSGIYPVSYQGYWTSTYDAQSMGLWRATFEQTTKNLPPILFDHKEGAAYSGSGVFTTNELDYLKSIGGTFKVNEGYIYTKSSPLFANFIGEVYQLRKQALEREDEALAYVLKIMMNSLYGKFAQREEGNKIILAFSHRVREYVNKGVPFKLMGDFMVIPEHRTVRHTFVAIAAMITANARIDLHRRMSEVINNGYDVYYCDTDSIHTNGTFQTSNELGEIKLENSGKAAYAGKKIYAFKNGKVKAKGIGRTITKGVLSYDTIEALALNKDAIEALTFDRFPSVKGVLGKKERAAVIQSLTRRIRNTGGIWDNEE